MGRVECSAGLRVSVVYSPVAGVVDETELQLDHGATVADALQASDLQVRHPGLDLGAVPVGLWGATCARDRLLRDRDRVEVYRALAVGPMEARRRRQQSQRKSTR